MQTFRDIRRLFNAGPHYRTRLYRTVAMFATIGIVFPALALIADAKTLDMIILTGAGLFIFIGYAGRYIVRELTPAAFGQVVHAQLVHAYRVFASRAPP